MCVGDSSEQRGAPCGTARATGRKILTTQRAQGIGAPRDVEETRSDDRKMTGSESHFPTLFRHSPAQSGNGTSLASFGFFRSAQCYAHSTAKEAGCRLPQPPPPPPRMCFALSRATFRNHQLKRLRTSESILRVVYASAA